MSTPLNTPDVSLWEEALCNLLKRALTKGVVLNIDVVSVPPLAMGRTLLVCVGRAANKYDTEHTICGTTLPAAVRASCGV